MTFSIYRHNKTAYNSAALMLNGQKGRDIHQTDTGNSFIEFKLC